jgi:hypothetical protein
VLAAAAVADDVAGGLRLFRRVAVPRRQAYNVVAEAGEASADRTMVVLAHHDAAPSGIICVAQAIQAQPVTGVRLIFLSAGAEEALQEGIRGFARRHFASLGPQTWFVNLESVGSGRLALLEGEGPVLMRDYQASFKDLAAACAVDLGIPLTRGLRSRNSTDSEVPRRHGFPVATIVSLDGDKLIPHYHLDSDTAEHVDLRSVDAAARLAEAIIRKVAA